MCLFCGAASALARAPLVMLTDFGTQDGAVSAMKGVAYSVSQHCLISDLSHENPSIFVGAYRLYQAEQFWPPGTVFVTVVDPGVGTSRLSVVLKTAPATTSSAPTTDSCRWSPSATASKGCAKSTNASTAARARMIRIPFMP